MVTPGPRIVGWWEWVSLPALGIVSVKAKLDTGAKTSALHAWDIEQCMIEDRPWVRFSAYARHRRDYPVARCAAPLTDRRWVTSSTGARERRCVISTVLAIGGDSWPIEITLTAREDMGFRMLVGREAMLGRLVVDPLSTGLAGRPVRRHRNAAHRE